MDVGVNHTGGLYGLGFMFMLRCTRTRTHTHTERSCAASGVFLLSLPL